MLNILSKLLIVFNCMWVVELYTLHGKVVVYRYTSNYTLFKWVFQSRSISFRHFETLNWKFICIIQFLQFFIGWSCGMFDTPLLEMFLKTCVPFFNFSTSTFIQIIQIADSNAGCSAVMGLTCFLNIGDLKAQSKLSHNLGPYPTKRPLHFHQPL